MPVPVSTSRRLAFDTYEADLHSGELRKNGKRIRLQAQPFQLLVMLLDRPGQLVTREEICQKLWSADTFVDFDHSLGTAINKIREVLNDSASEPRFVETLPRRGYRFIAPVTPVEEDLTPVPASEEAQQAPPKNRTFYWVAGVCVAVMLLAAALVGMNFRGWRQWSLSKLTVAEPVRSIAVLPLVNLSSDPDQQFFADGVTDELITSLAQISSLRVISRTSAMAYLGSHKPAAQIARELGVDALVEGSVVRSGNKVRITAQLIYAASDRHLWAQSYDRELSDVLTVQGEVARAIAESISLRLTPEERAVLSRPHPVNPEVALLIFKGSHFLSTPDPLRAKEIFNEAIRLDPNNAEAWAGLADSLHTMGVMGQTEAFPQAREAANKALEIDPSQAQALMVLGVVSFIYDWNPKASEPYFERSLKARPGYSMCHALFATILAHLGRTDEAIRQIQLASASDPVSVPINSFAWHVYFCARKYDLALKIILGAVELDPNFRLAYGRLAKSWEQKGDYQKAIAARLQGRLVGGMAPEKAKQEAAEAAAAFTSGGPRGYWQHKLDIIPPQERYGQDVARCYMHLGQREEALKALEKSYQMKDDPYLIVWLPVSEEFDALRSEPRFQRLLNGLS